MHCCCFWPWSLACWSCCWYSMDDHRVGAWHWHLHWHEHTRHTKEDERHENDARCNDFHRMHSRVCRDKDDATTAAVPVEMDEVDIPRDDRDNALVEDLPWRVVVAVVVDADVTIRCCTGADGGNGTEAGVGVVAEVDVHVHVYVGGNRHVEAVDHESPKRQNCECHEREDEADGRHAMDAMPPMHCSRKMVCCYCMIFPS
mmetsp:Transcript_31123/g.64520  ORF Transcript_31123/g.64520 Transcript_31123/m.64520 type:complete len:201 (-) Transcript_31123:446-1048(-)